MFGSLALLIRRIKKIANPLRQVFSQSRVMTEFWRILSLVTKNKSFMNIFNTKDWIDKDESP